MNLEYDQFCFACGRENPIGLKLAFGWADERLTCEFTPNTEHQGWKDVTHGGIISTVLDECIVHAAIRKSGRMSVTAEMTVRFMAPLLTGQKVLVTARADEPGRRLITASARMVRLTDGVEIAHATAKLIVQD